jgi:chromate reductase
MITVLSCTNREHNLTQVLAGFYYRSLISSGVEAKFLDFRNIPERMMFDNPVFNGNGVEMHAVAEEFIIHSDKIVFIIPEYNGSYPGILKVFIDGMKPEWFRNKKAAIIGMSTGRAGNLRGMDHLTDILMYLNMHVMNNRLPISRFHTLLDENRELSDAYTITALHNHQTQLINF